MAGLEPYVLRYWESEFKEITPIKSKSNQRLYRKKDIDMVLLIKKLLYSEGFTIDGARKRIRELRTDTDHTKAEIPDVEDKEQMTLGFSGNEDFSPHEETKSIHSKADTKFLKNIKKELEDLVQILQR